MRNLSFIVLVFCASCGPVENINIIRSPDGSVSLEIKEQLRGASSSNSYYVSYIDKDSNREEIFQSYSGTRPVIRWIGKNELAICTYGEDRYTIKRKLNAQYEKLFIRHIDKSTFKDCVI